MAKSHVEMRATRLERDGYPTRARRVLRYKVIFEKPVSKKGVLLLYDTWAELQSYIPSALDVAANAFLGADFGSVLHLLIGLTKTMRSVDRIGNFYTFSYLFM